MSFSFESLPLATFAVIIQSTSRDQFSVVLIGHNIRFPKFLGRCAWVCQEKRKKLVLIILQEVKREKENKQRHLFVDALLSSLR